MDKNGCRKSLWKLKSSSSGFSRNLQLSWRRASIANMLTLEFSWQPIFTKCFAIKFHMSPHMRRGRLSMLQSATSTSLCKEKVRGVPFVPPLGTSEALSRPTPLMPFLESPTISVSETATRQSTKCTMLTGDRLTLDENTFSIKTSLIASSTALPLFSSVSLAISTLGVRRKKLLESSVNFCFFPSPKSSGATPEAKSCNRPSCEMHCNTGCQLSPRCSPSMIAILNRVLMHSMFFRFISLTKPRVVNCVSDKIKVFLARAMPV
mmetsp:Transcript_31336/g.37284  ORF Transcript_31336/g.37284 Transcript_31336/m.37284 type:complete len:264 (+) Transcript_31336:2598-3389(+)